ncbi:unnamed protein product [Heligmosomoides polygyrus]|uniref:HTH_48 domain-containing protein n=1 Tax=Heligmosomoides polygyrus TaxID=6339 RepID=A0A183FI12_HELPZ|nr:unnamed protein product [Heligmosomoides polygyrus]
MDKRVIRGIYLYEFKLGTTAKEADEKINAAFGLPCIFAASGELPDGSVASGELPDGPAASGEFPDGAMFPDIVSCEEMGCPWLMTCEQGRVVCPLSEDRCYFRPPRCVVDWFFTWFFLLFIERVELEARFLEGSGEGSGGEGSADPRKYTIIHLHCAHALYLFGNLNADSCPSMIVHDANTHSEVGKCTVIAAANHVPQQRG